MFPMEHTVPYVPQGTQGAVKSLWNIWFRMFPCSDWATTPIQENIPDSLGDNERVKAQ